MFRDTDALATFVSVTADKRNSDHLNLFDHVGAELLHGQRTDVASELADDGVTETIVIQIENVLDNLEE